MDLEKSFQLVKQGAEARLYKGLYLGRPAIVKERFQKKYRHAELDERLTKDRIKAEARAIIRCKIAGIATPAVYFVDINKRCIFMEEIEESVTVKDYIIQSEGHGDDKTALLTLAEKIGAVLGKMHANSIIHGDLTTSNMLLKKNLDNLDLVLIDFGLSHFDISAEDKGVDLYVLERAFLSTHPDTEKLFELILQSYCKENKKGATEVIKKLNEVRLRGRKRTMVG